MARLFVAVWPPDDVAAHLASLPRPDEAGVRWTTPAQWHVTLHFCGSADLDAATAALARVAAAPAVATMGPSVQRLGAGVVQVPVTGLDAVAAAVRGAFAGVGEPQPDRPFVGHLTLARLRRTRRCSLLGAPVAATFAVDEVALVRSTTDPDGAVYDTVAVQRLRG